MPLLISVLAASVLAAEPSTLPLRKLRLYETGVGYFERRGNVSPRDSLGLPVPSSHLDDALKSLVVLEATGGVKISGIDFDSSVSQSMARALAGLPEQGDEPLAYDDVLESLKGSRVRIRAEDGSFSGRFVDLEGPFRLATRPPGTAAEPTIPATAGNPSQAPARTQPHYTLIVLDDDDALRRVQTHRIEAIEVLDERTAARLDVAATALSDQAARQTTALTVQVSDAGRLGLGYVSEAPVWRTTYRVVMPPEGTDGQLQAWALVHNDTDESWSSVSVELANGRPSSFLHPLAAPRYAARELVSPPDDLSSVPQLANRTVDALYDIGDLGGGGGIGLIGSGYGAGGSAGLSPRRSAGLRVRAGIDPGGVTLGDLAELAQASGAESGALFLYRVADPIDLPAHHSALLPIVQQAIEVESITWFGTAEHEGLSAARLVNTTPQTMPPGTVSFFADGGFVGEAMLGRLKPEERRFIPYGFELDVELATSRRTVSEEVAVLRFKNDAIVEHYVQDSELTLDIHNRSGRPRRVYVVLDVPRRADLTGDGAVALDYDLTRDAPLATTTVGGRAEVSHTLRARELKLRTHEDLGLASLVELRDRAGVPEPQRALLETAISLARRSEQLDQRGDEASRAITRLERDLDRVRKDLAALRTSNGRNAMHTRLGRELLRKESAIDTRRKQLEGDRAEAEQARRRSVAILERLDQWQPTPRSPS